ncbi:dCTP deaminase [Paenibacillus woosongensis]|uniref:dCTP deaminase n=1 Tax=Paenibacillus woosongensis TaxID=307580 RepID=A0AA95I6S6_9BACL|nr:dCTP deaminase [Paenibacillus woosongensis]WHX50775.1 dCTP deaminase [Paenibacillus woosongensis]
MILADVDILKLIRSKELIVTEFREQNLRPNGIRVHLSNEVITYASDQVVDLRNSVEVSTIKLQIDEDQGYILKPNEFILMATKEQILTPKNIIGYLEGRSTIARLGLSIHCTSGVIDNMYGEKRSIVLEIKNTGPLSVRLYPNAPIGMLMFHQLTNDVQQAAQSQYKNQDSVQGPNLRFTNGG